MRFDDGSSMRLYRQTVEDFGLYTGKEMTEQEHAELRKAAGEMSAKMRAVRIVSASSVSKRDLEYRLVQKSGSWFSMGDERIGQGKDSVKAFLMNNPDIAEDVEAKVREKLIAGAASRAAARAAERPVAVSADDFDDED